MSTTDLNTIAENLAELLTTVTSQTSAFYNLFLSTTPQDVTFLAFDANNQLVEVTIPNRAKDRQIATSGNGSPEGVVTGNVGEAYVDQQYNQIYYKISGTGSTGWTLALTRSSIETLLQDYVPKTRTVNNKALSNDITLTASDINAMSSTEKLGKSLEISGINLTLKDQDGVALSSVPIVTTGANKDLSNLTSTGEAHFQAPITGGASTITSSNLTASRALVSDSSGKVAVSAVTSTELGYVDGVTSNIQTQLNGTVKTTGNQTIAGVKTFSSTPVVTSGIININNSTQAVIQKQGANFIRQNSTGATIISSGGTDKSIVLRPNGDTNTSGNATLDTNGNLTAVKFTGPLTGNATTATTATKLGTATKGSATQPIYLNGGVPTVITSYSGNAATATTLTGLTSTVTELNYCDGVTSSIQTQLNAKQATITGGATTITSSNLTASRALVSDSSGKVAASAVTSTELGYLDGVTSAIQTQLNGKTSVNLTDVSSAGKNTVLNWAVPNYSAGVSVASGYTVTQPSMALWFKYSGGLWWGVYFWINGIEFGCGGNTYGDRASGSSVTAYVTTGDVLTFSSGYVKVFPLKGV